MGGMHNVPGHKFELLDKETTKNPVFIVGMLVGFAVIGTVIGITIKKELDNTKQTNTTTVEPDLITDTMETPVVGEIND